MLDIEIKHDIDKNYLVVHGNNENTYMLKMLAGNSVKGFLDMEVRVLNNVNQYYYDITGKENFQQKSARGKWTQEELRKTVSDILGCLQKSKEYLLTPEHFVLEPQYMYRDIESGEVFLCYAWNYDKNINEQLTELFAYFMNVVDYGDDNAVDLVYKLYDVSREENCTLQRLWSALAVPKVKRIIIEEEPVKDEIQNKISHKTRMPLGLKKQGEKPVPQPLSSQKPGEKLSPKPVRLKKRRERPTQKSYSQKNQEERPLAKLCRPQRPEDRSASKLFGVETKIKIKKSDEKSGDSKKKTVILKNNIIQEEKSGTFKNTMLLKILLIVVLQLAIIGVIFIGAKYGFFFENRCVSYTKTGGTLLILAVLDMYLMTKIFGVEEDNGKSEISKETQEESMLLKLAEEDKREKNHSSSKRENRSPFILEQEVKQSALKKNRNQAIQLQKEISLNSAVASGDFDGTLILDYEKTIIDNHEMELLKNKKKCYLVPDKKDYAIISLGEFPFFIGRFQKDTGSLREIKNISRMHSKIEQIGSSFFITDLNSTNGTFVNQKRLEKDKKMELYEGDEVTFANVPYHFTMQEI